MRILINLLLLLLSIHAGGLLAQKDSASDIELREQIEKVSLVQWHSNTMIDSLQSQLSFLRKNLVEMEGETQESFSEMEKTITIMSVDMVGLTAGVTNAQEDTDNNSRLMNLSFIAFLLIILILFAIGYFIYRVLQKRIKENEDAFKLFLHNQQQQLLDNIQRNQHEQTIVISQMRSEISTELKEGSLSIQHLKDKMKVIKKEQQLEISKIAGQFDKIQMEVGEKHKKIKTAVSEVRTDLNEKMAIQQSHFVQEMKKLNKEINSLAKSLEKMDKPAKKTKVSKSALSSKVVKLK